MRNRLIALLVLFTVVIFSSAQAQTTARKFEAGKNTFLLDGEPFVVKAAELHYTRIPQAYWEHRIEMCKALGMNTICIYIFWNIHEQEEGKFDFSGQNDIAAFCRAAQKHGMYVIVRPGPYVCAEWEMGGLPWWLLKKKDVALRTLDPYYMELNYGLTSIKEYAEAIPEEGREISFGGMVTKFDSRPSSRGGNFGILSMEDYTGSCELRLFGQKYIDFANYGKPGTPIMVTGRFERRYNGEVRFEVQRIRLLNEVKGQMLSGISLDLEPEEVNDRLNGVLQEILKSSGENHGNLTVRIFDKTSNKYIKLTSGFKIPLTRELTKKLDSLEVKYDFSLN